MLYPGEIEEVSSVVGIVDFSSVAIVSEAGGVFELASPTNSVDNSGASLTAIEDMSLAAAASGFSAVVDVIILAKVPKGTIWAKIPLAG